MATKNLTIKSIRKGSALLFTSAGGIRGGQIIKLPVAEATKLIEKGYAIKITVRRKKRNAAKNADTGNGGGSGNTGGEQSDAFAPDAQAAAVNGAGVEHSSSASRGDPDNDSGIG